MEQYRIAVVGKHNHLNWDVAVAKAFRRLGHDVDLHRFNDFPWWFDGLRVSTKRWSSRSPGPSGRRPPPVKAAFRDAAMRRTGL